MKRTKEEAQVTKNLIIEKAVALSLQQGFSKTTLDDIARQANVTRGAIYWHFTDKLDILNALIEKEHQHLKQLLSSLFSEEIPPLSKIEKIIEGIVGHFFENASFQHFIELTWFKIEYTQLAKLQSTKSELTRYFIENFKGVVKEAQKMGVIKSELIDSDVALTITNMINGMYRLYFILPPSSKIKKAQCAIFMATSI